jgi:hypothetical protein
VVINVCRTSRIAPDLLVNPLCHLVRAHGLLGIARRVPRLQLLNGMVAQRRLQSLADKKRTVYTHLIHRAIHIRQQRLINGHLNPLHHRTHLLEQQKQQTVALYITDNIVAHMITHSQAHRKDHRLFWMTPGLLKSSVLHFI